MPLSHAAHRSLAASVFALTMFFAPHLFAGADEMIALWRAAPAANEPISLRGEDAALAPALQDLFAFGDLGPPFGEPGSFELDAATQAALDDALRYLEGSATIAEAM
jgi:hypothetical protein